MTDKLTTYEEVAKEYGLTGETERHYIAYMKTRWGDAEDERVKCLVGYAGEWAGRFLSGIEYQASDYVGQAILKTMGHSR